MDVLEWCEWHHDAEVGDVHHHGECVFGGYDAVGNESCNELFSSGCCSFTWIVDAVAANNEPCSIIFGFLRTNAAHELALCDVFHVVAQDVTFGDELDGVGTFDATTHPFARRPNSFTDEIIQTFLYLGCHIKVL